jgi:hypothetical protein
MYFQRVNDAFRGDSVLVFEFLIHETYVMHLPYPTLALYILFKDLCFAVCMTFCISLLFYIYFSDTF